jgi:t-SNARE complex subunit (syntaxin)
MQILQSSRHLERGLRLLEQHQWNTWLLLVVAVVEIISVVVVVQVVLELVLDTQ